MKKVLYVDDQPFICEDFKALYQSKKLHVDIAFSVDEAIQLISAARENNYSLIITDYIMPDKNGDELLSYCKQNYPDIPLALCSAYHESVNRDSYCHLLDKPWDTKQIDSIVEQVYCD